MGGQIFKAFKFGNQMKDIPRLTEYLANNPVFIKYALKVNKSTNSGLSRFQKFLHESAFPEENDRHKPSNKESTHRLHNHEHQHKDHHNNHKKK